MNDPISDLDLDILIDQQYDRRRSAQAAIASGASASNRTNMDRQDHLYRCLLELKTLRSSVDKVIKDLPFLGADR